MKIACLFSGGKDSTYALYNAIQEEHSVECLVAIKSKRRDSWMFHTPNIEYVEVQARALDIPIIIEYSKGEKEKELYDLKRALKKSIKEYNIKGVYCGALASNYQRTRVEKICNELNLTLFSPLWHKEPEAYMNELIKSGFKILITAIASFGLSKKWLGRKLDKKVLDDLIKLNKKTKIHLGGEGGEYETFVLDGPIFKKRVKILDYAIEMENEYTGRLIIRDLSLIRKKKQD